MHGQRQTQLGLREALSPATHNLNALLYLMFGHVNWDEDAFVVVDVKT